MSIQGDCDIMTTEKGRKWDGKSRISNDTYRKRFDEIFKKKTKPQKLNKDDQEYLDSLKGKL